ncbi:hypothetical protein ES703_48609 [subsurface metagenome]
MLKENIRKKQQEYINIPALKLTKLFVCTILVCSLGAAAQQTLEYEQLSSESCSLTFYDMAYDIIHSEDINQVKAEQAIVLLKAARELDENADYVVRDLIKLNWRYSERNHSDLIYELLTSHLNERADRQIIKMAASYLLDKTNTRDEREQLINELIQTFRGKNSYLSSELLTSLGILRSELSDPNASRYFVSAYSDNKYNQLAFAKLLESIPDEINPVAYLEHLRLISGENPLDIEAAVNFAEYARKLQLYQVAADAYEYCSQLYNYLYPSKKLPSYIYLPWSISAYNTKQSQYKCLQIASTIEKEDGFDLILEAIAAKAAIKMDDIERAEEMFEDAEKKAKANYYTDNGKQLQQSKIETCNSLAWFYCFAREDANQALEWAEKAHTIEPNSPTINGLLAYSLVMNKQTKRAEEIAQKFQLNQIANLALAQIQLLEGQKESAIQTLKEAIEKDAGSFEAELAKQKLLEQGERYTPQLDAEAIVASLINSIERSLVPKFIPPDKILSVQVNLRGTRFAYGKDFGASLTIKNDSDEPLIISDNGLFSGNIRIDAKIRGDINKNIPNLVSLKYQPTSPIEPGKSILIPLNLNTGELRQILFGHPQASLGIIFTFYLDPVITKNKNVDNKLADIKPIVHRATRPAEKISAPYLRHQINSLPRGDQEQKVRTARLFAGLLAEQQAVHKRRTDYQFMYADWMPAVLKSVLLKCLKDEDWNVKTQTMAAMVGLPLNGKLINAVAENLNDSEWPVRLMALYLLANNNRNFSKVLDWTARYDSNALVREMAVALGGSEPEPEPEPETVVPAGLQEPNLTNIESEPNQTNTDITR